MMTEKEAEDRKYLEEVVAATARAHPADFDRLIELAGGIQSFRTPAARKLVEMLSDRIPAGLPIDPPALALDLTPDEIRRIGGQHIISMLCDRDVGVADYQAEKLRLTAVGQQAVTDLESAAFRVRTGEDLERSLEAAAETVASLQARAAGLAPTKPTTSSWGFTDLSDVLDGTHKPIMPTVGARHDGVGLFYPGRLNDVSGESEGGKTWFALIACLVEVGRGNHVVYLDFEDEAAGVIGRAMQLGGKPDQLRAYFHYVRPELAPGTGDVDRFVRMVSGVTPTLVVVDGITEAMAMFGLELKDNTEIAKFGRHLLRPLASTGAAVVTLDHVVKDRDSRGRYSLGGVHKLNGINGVKYVVEAVAPFGVGLTGRSRVRIAKDRPAQLRRHALPGGERMHWFADLVVESCSETEVRGFLYEPYERPAEEVSQATPEELAHEKETVEIEDRKKAIVAALQRAKKPLSKKDIEERVSGRATVTRRALNDLVDSGALLTEPGARNAVLHSLPSGELPLEEGEAA
ncbi:AAA family ATPase [Streptacidiphilus anmyonensis]|uniref:AAA family ATPase n=1 Tax=Streptacidiphilus anmyonensis TaxID=405782 RepID=UPI00069478C8|nr:AAA family ATPase [Streptacidiphilus anmyonensis]